MDSQISFGTLVLFDIFLNFCSKCCPFGDSRTLESMFDKLSSVFDVCIVLLKTGVVVELILLLYKRILNFRIEI